MPRLEKQQRQDNREVEASHPFQDEDIGSHTRIFRAEAGALRGHFRAQVPPEFPQVRLGGALLVHRAGEGLRRDFRSIIGKPAALELPHEFQGAEGDTRRFVS